MSKDILSFIRKGKENGISLNELIKLTGLKNRALRKQIEFLRRNGEVIVSDVHGYYFPSDEIELGIYIKQEQARARSISKTLRSAKKAYENMVSEQVSI